MTIRGCYAKDDYIVNCRSHSCFTSGGNFNLYNYARPRHSKGGWCYRLKYVPGSRITIGKDENGKGLTSREVSGRFH